MEDQVEVIEIWELLDEKTAGRQVAFIVGGNVFKLSEGYMAEVNFWPKAEVDNLKSL